MKFGHPRVYNPWQSEELAGLQRSYDVAGRIVRDHVNQAKEMINYQRIIVAQMQDCHLTPDEQVARLDALDEIGAPQ